jgi:hypothetical protein
MAWIIARVPFIWLGAKYKVNGMAELRRELSKKAIGLPCRLPEAPALMVVMGAKILDPQMPPTVPEAQPEQPEQHVEPEEGDSDILEEDRVPTGLLIQTTLETKPQGFVLSVDNFHRVIQLVWHDDDRRELWPPEVVIAASTWKSKPEALRLIQEYTISIAHDVYLIRNLHVGLGCHSHPLPDSLGSVEQVMAYAGDVADFLEMPSHKQDRRLWLSQLVLRLPPNTKHYILLLDPPWPQMALSDLELLRWPPVRHRDRSGRKWNMAFCYRVRERYTPRGVEVNFARISKPLIDVIGRAAED